MGRGTRRERWWRSVNESRNLDTSDFRGSPDSCGALSVYLHEKVQQLSSRVVTHVNEDWDDDRRQAGTLSEWKACG